LRCFHSPTHARACACASSSSAPATRSGWLLLTFGLLRFFGLAPAPCSAFSASTHITHIARSSGRMVEWDERHRQMLAQQRISEQVGVGHGQTVKMKAAWFNMGDNGIAGSTYQSDIAVASATARGRRGAPIPSVGSPQSYLLVGACIGWPRVSFCWVMVSLFVSAFCCAYINGSHLLPFPAFPLCLRTWFHILVCALRFHHGFAFVLWFARSLACTRFIAVHRSCPSSFFTLEKNGRIS